MAAHIDRFIQLLGKYEGRDKLNKIIQYGSRFWMHVLQDSNPELSERFKFMFKDMAKARKLFRMVKWLIEYRKISKILQKPASGNQVDYALTMLVRVSFFVYWVFDNLFVLAQVKFMKADHMQFKKPAMYAWFSANIFCLISEVRKQIKISSQEATLRAEIKDELTDAETAQTQLDKLASQRFESYLNILKRIGDGIVAMTGAGVSE